MDELTDVEVLEALVHLLEMDDARQLMQSGEYLIAHTNLQLDEGDTITTLTDAEKLVLECLNHTKSSELLKAVVKRLKLVNILEG